jgi:hypothetical protein
MSSNSNAENNIMSNNFPSLCIPRVYPNIKEERIRKIFQELALGELERIDIVNKTSEKGEKFNRVFIHFKTWYAEGNAEVARKRLIEGKDIKIIYDDPWFWKVSAYKERVQKPLPEKKPVKPKVTLIIESDDEEPAAAYNRDDRRPRDNYEQRPRDDRRPRDNYEQRPRDDRRPANYEQRPRDDRRPHYDERRPAKPNDSFKKTKKEDFNNNIAPALSSPMVLLASKPNPVVVKEELPVVPVAVKEEPVVGEKLLMKPRVIKSKEQKEKEKKANHLLVSHII